MKHKPLRATNRRHKPLLLFPRGPRQPTATSLTDPTTDTKQSTTLALGLGPMVPPSEEPKGQVGLPTRPPSKKVPEGEPFEPKLTVEVSGPGFGKYWRPLRKAHQELPTSWPGPAASRPRHWARNSGACVHPEVGGVFHVPGSAQVYCTHSLLWPQQLWRRAWCDMLGTRRARDMQGYKEVAGGGLDVALPSPLSTGRPSQLDTCKSLSHPFIQPKNIC